MKKLLFDIAYQVPSHGVKKNSRQIRRNRATGKPFIGKTDVAKGLELYHAGMLMVEKNRLGLETITDDIVAEFYFVYPRTEIIAKSGKRKLNKGDLSNLIQMPEDALQEAKIIENDSQIMSFGGTGIRMWDRSIHLIRIKLFTFKGSLDYDEDK